MNKEDLKLAGAILLVGGAAVIGLTGLCAVVWLFIVLWPTNPIAAILITSLLVGFASLLVGINILERVKYR